jgi:hypothetical protein
MLGSPFGSVVYVGHPVYKRIGAGECSIAG